MNIEEKLRELGEEQMLQTPVEDRPIDPEKQQPICMRCLQPYSSQMHGPVDTCTEDGTADRCHEPKAHHKIEEEPPAHWILRVSCGRKHFPDGYECNKPKGHTGQHIAWGGVFGLLHKVASWED